MCQRSLTLDVTFGIWKHPLLALSSQATDELESPGSASSRRAFGLGDRWTATCPRPPSRRRVWRDLPLDCSLCCLPARIPAEHRSRGDCALTPVSNCGACRADSQRTAPRPVCGFGLRGPTAHGRGRAATDDLRRPAPTAWVCGQTLALGTLM